MRGYKRIRHPAVSLFVVAAFYAILKDSIVETTVDAHSRVMVLAGGNIIAVLVVFVSSVLFLTTLTGKDSLPFILLFPISMFIECITLITSNLIRIRKLQKTKQQLDTKTWTAENIPSTYN